MPADRCPTCDRDGCPMLQPNEHIDARRGECPACAASIDCGRHAVDWRARALAAEDRIAQVAEELADDLATAQAEIDRAVAGLAVASMLPSSSRLRHGATPTVRAWLGRLVERLRGGAVESDAAKDRDAAKWRRVGPMIERLREAAKVARHDYATDDDATVDHRVTGHELIDAVSELLAAAKEPS